MIFLQEEERPDAQPSQGELDQVTTLLGSLQTALTTLLTAGRSNQKEAKAWLINAIAGLDLRDAGLRRRKFGQFLPGGSAFDRAQHEDFGRQLVQALFTDEPQKVSRLVAREPSVLQRFFRADPAHVRLWFGHFSMAGTSEFKHGAYALARYAMLHRDEVWRLLVWGGKHPQAPVAVAQKTHYFCELDVPATVANLLEECPEFWESEELQEGLQSGQLLALAPGFWSQELYGWLKEYSPRSDRLFGLVCDYLESGADWRLLCGRLLHLLPPADLHAFACGLLDGCPLPAAAAAAAAGLSPSSYSPAAPAAAAAAGGPVAASAPLGAWLVFRGGGWGGLDPMLVASAVGCNLRQLGRLAREEENGEELQEMRQLASRLGDCERPGLHWHLRRQLVRQAHQARRAEHKEQHSERPAEAGSQGSQRGIGGIRGFLLLHLLAAYLQLQQLAVAIPGSGGATASGSSAAQQFQHLVEAAGLSCRSAQPTAAGPAGAASQVVGQAILLGEGLGSEEERGRGRGRERRRKARKEKRKSAKKAWRRRRRSGSREGSRGGKRKRRRSEAGGSKERRRKRRRRGSSGGSSSNEDSGSSSEGSGGPGGGLEEEWGAEFEALPATAVSSGFSQGNSLWVLGPPGGQEVTLTAAETVDYIMDRLAAAYAAWLCAQRS